MPFEDLAKNEAVDAITAIISHISLCDESLTELSGGSPAYARKAITWGGTAAGGVDDNTGALVFDVAGGDGVYFIGLTNHLTTGDGKTVGWWPAGAQPLQIGVVAASTDAITSDAHGLVDNDRVVFMDKSGGGLPTGLTEGVVYHVVSATTDTFDVSLTQGGSSVDVTVDGEVFFVECIPEEFTLQGTYTIADGALDLVATVI